MPNTVDYQVDLNSDRSLKQEREASLDIRCGLSATGKLSAWARSGHEVTPYPCIVEMSRLKTVLNESQLLAGSYECRLSLRLMKVLTRFRLKQGAPGAPAPLVLVIHRLRTRRSPLAAWSPPGGSGCSCHRFGLQRWQRPALPLLALRISLRSPPFFFGVCLQGLLLEKTPEVPSIKIVGAPGSPGAPISTTRRLRTRRSPLAAR